MFENVDGWTDDGRTADAGVIGILIAHLVAFVSGELIRPCLYFSINLILNFRTNGSRLQMHHIIFSMPDRCRVWVAARGGFARY